MSALVIARCVCCAVLKEARLGDVLSAGTHNEKRLRSFRAVLLGVALAGLFLSVPVALRAQSPASSGTVITIAGNGVRDFAGDGGPATNASFADPGALAIGRDGTLYLVDSSNFRIRAINPTNGIITTVVGDGVANFSDPPYGDGGPATDAEIGDALALAVDRGRNALYFPASGSGHVRQVSFASGGITNFAGWGLFDPFPVGEYGDGGAATSAWLETPTGVAVDRNHNVYIVDINRNRLRKVDGANGIMHTVAGFDNPPGLPVVAQGGDGGPASAASFFDPARVAVDDAGNLYIMEYAYTQGGVPGVVRCISAATGIINTIAGGGTNLPGTGPARSMNIDDVNEIALSGTNTLFIGTPTRVLKMNLITGILAPYAGSTNAGFNGDGGPALNALFQNITGLAVAPGGGLVIADQINQRIRYVVPDSINLTNDSQQTEFHLPWISALAGNLTVANNTNVGIINLGSLVTVSGSINISGNTSAGSINISSVVSAGSIDISGNTSATGINAGGLTTVSGGITINGNTAAGGIDISSVTSAGSIDLSGNTSASVINIGGLTTSGGSIDISGNTSAGSIDMSSVTSAGSIAISGNTSATNIDASSANAVCGDVTITSNAPNASINLNSLTNFGCGTNAMTMTVDGSVAVTNGLTVGTNATLAGNATLDGSVTNNGTISPGSPVGGFDITGNLILADSSRLRLEVAGYAPGQFDMVNVTGSVRLGGALSVSLLNPFPSLMTNGASFILLTAGSPLTGAFANAPSGGSLTTTDGYARFTVRYAGETTLRLTDLVIVDTDHDGMPDWWEDRFGLSKTDPADAVADADGDGASNLNEFLAGTDPMDPASVFRILGAQPEAGGVRLTWSTVGGKSYVVQTNAPSSSGSFTNNFADFSQLITAPGTGEATTNLIDAAIISNVPARYYRVRLGP